MTDTHLIHSEVNNDYLSNPYPGFGEALTIMVKVSERTTPDHVYCRIIRDGHRETPEMREATRTPGFVWYKCDIVIDQPQINYHFMLASGDERVFYTRAGISSFQPTEDHDWVVMSDFENPSWVPSAVFYQIFPDRFRKGGDAGVKTGEYEFDGGTTTAMNWTDEPLSFEKGRCLDFYNGDLDGVREGLDYLQSLGVTALYLNPIFEARTTHRYDCTDYFKVDSHLGGDDALVRLTDEAHKRGMRIMVDVSINHTGIEHRWFKKATRDPESKEASYYYRNDDGSFAMWEGVPTLPQLNYTNPELRDVMFGEGDSLVRHFLRPPFRIDAWRFDVGNQTGRRGRDQLSHEIFREVRKAIKDEKQDAYIIGEHWEDNISYLLGDQWDASMNYFGSGRPLRSFAGQSDRFSGFSEFPPKTVVPVTGVELASMLMQHITRLPNQIAFLQFNLLDSHDIHRFHNHAEVYSEGLYRGIIMMLYVLPGTPNVYYGSEIGIQGDIDTVEGCRYPMPWDESEWDESLQEFHAALGGLKTSEEALQTGSYSVVHADEESMSMVRFMGDTGFLAVINRCEHTRRIDVDLSLVAPKSAADALSIPKGFGVGATLELSGNTLKLELPAGESRLIRLALDVERR